MNMELIKKIEAKISDLEAQFKKSSEFISSANAAMDKLASDRALANNECNKLDGAIQMAKSVLAEMSEPKQSEPIACNAEVISDS